MALYYVSFVTFTTSQAILQEIITNFYDNFGIRLRYIRQSRSLTLAELSNGSASTAQSWETGIFPRTKRWTEIAARLKVSEPFLFKGIPSTDDDYEFIRLHRNQIGDAPSRWSTQPVNSTKYEDKMHGVAQQSPQLASNDSIRDHMQLWYEAATRNPNVAPYVFSQLKKHLSHDDLKFFDNNGNS